MARPTSLKPCARLLICLVGAALLSQQSALALSVRYCSGLNTASDFDPVYDEYQSNGACHDQCNPKYAFAVVQGSYCWCSDYAPGETASDDDCSQICPGYGTEKCGSTDNQLYGYIPLGKSPSGTQGGPSSTTQATSSESTSVSTESVESTSSSSSTETSTEPTSVQSSTSSTPTSTWSATPVTSVMTVTGALRTVTITPTEPPRSTTPVAQQTRENSLWSSAGKVAGLFVGLALLILLVAAGVLYFLWRRRRARQAAVASDYSFNHSTPPRSRPMSELALISDNRTLAGDKATPGSGSRLPQTPGADHSPTESKRNSQGRIIDQRLDPGLLWSPTMDNSSRVSLRSLHDDQDYSRRVLRLVNPDGASA